MLNRVSDTPIVGDTQTPLNGVFHGRLPTPYILWERQDALSFPLFTFLATYKMHSGPLSLIVGTSRVGKLTKSNLHFDRLCFSLCLLTMIHLSFYKRICEEKLLTTFKIVNILYTSIRYFTAFYLYTLKNIDVNLTPIQCPYNSHCVGINAKINIMCI